MSSPLAAASGATARLVLCQVGTHWLALVADEVARVGSLDEELASNLPHARLAFSLPPSQVGRAVHAQSGEALVVDSVAVQPEACNVMATPWMMRRQLGGSLTGFASIRNQLCPVVELAAFSRFLRSVT